MAVTYQIHPERALIVVTRTTDISAEDWEAFLGSMISDPAFERGFTILEDRRLLTELPTRGQVERASRWIMDHSDKLGTMRWAIVVPPSSPAAFGMARVREALTNGGTVTVRAFTDYDAALVWVQQAGDEV